MTDGTEFRGGNLLGGKRNEPIEVVPWDPAWAPRYEGMRARLAQALGDLAVKIEHVGSTAIDGLPAKPIVDIQISVPDVEDTDAYRGAIESQDLALRYIEAGHRYFRPPPELPRAYHVHVCEVGSQWERDHLLFRDYLRAHPDVAAEYGRMKMRLATQHRQDRIQYTDDKGPFIIAVLDAGEQWAKETGWQP